MSKIQNMPDEGFNTVIHAPNRLKICAALATSAELEFKVIKDELEVSDSVLSKHLKILEDAGYIRLIKRTEFGHLRTWLSFTTVGRRSFNNHVRELRKIVGEG